MEIATARLCLLRQEISVSIVITEPKRARRADPRSARLHPRDYDRWLGIDDKGGDPRPPFDLLHPYDAARMKMTPANPAVETGATMVQRCWINKGDGSLAMVVPSDD